VGEVTRNRVPEAADEGAMLTVILAAPGVYRAELRAADGSLICRLVGPAWWLLEQLEHTMPAPPAVDPCSIVPSQEAPRGW
jgi:hypothetical protein